MGRMDNTSKLLVSLGIPQIAGIIGSFFTSPNISTWYAGLSKPELAPPNWVFGPVWITLFILMGVSAFLIWKRGLEKRDVKIALGIFLFQLILNTFWSIIFFAMQSPGLAFAWIIILWVTIIANIYFFSRISKTSALLLVPYALWVSFATYLNYAIWMLN